jgi:hypothetical protein
MRKWIILAVVLAVLGAASVVALTSLNSYLNRNRDWIAEQAKAALGREVAFDEIGVSVLGGVGARLVNLRVADDPKFSPEDFVRAAQVRVTVRILPALFGRYEVSRFILEKPLVTVIRTAAGFNFDTIGAAGEAAAGAEAGPEAVADGAKSPGSEKPSGAEVLPLLVSAMRISDGEVRFVDRTAAKAGAGAGELTVRKIDFDASNVGFSTPVELELRAALLDADDQNVALEGTVGPVGDLTDVQRIPAHVAVDVGPLDVDALLRAVPAAAAQLPPGLGLTGPVRLRATISGSPAEVTVSDLDLAATVFGAKERNLTVAGTIGPVRPDALGPDLDVNLKLALGPVVIDDMKRLDAVAAAFPKELSGTRPVRLEATASGKVDRLQLNATFSGEDAEIRYGPGFVKPSGVPLGLEVAAKRADGAVDVQTLKVRLATLNASGSGRVTITAPQALDVQLAVSPTALAGWEKLLPALQDYDLSGTLEAKLAAKGALAGEKLPAVTGAVTFRDVHAQADGSPQRIDELSGTLEFTGNGVVLPPTKFKLGGSPAELRATVEPLDAPVVQFAFNSPELSAAAIGAADPEAEGGEVFRSLAVEGTLRTAGEKPQFRGTIRSPSGRLRNVDYQALQADLGLQNDVATLDSVSVRAFDGTTTASGRYDMRNAQAPAFDVRTNVAAVALQPLLGGWFPDAAGKIEGTLDANLSLAGSGEGWETIKRTLRGNGRAAVTNGALKGVNVAGGVLGGVTGIPGLAVLVPPKVREKHAALFTDHDTSFDTLSGSVDIADGGASTNDLVVSARDFTMRGQGRMTFDSRVDFTATLFLSPALSKEVIDDVHAAKHLADAQGRLEIPFRIAGVLPDARPVPDLSVVTKALSGAVVEEGLGKLLGIGGTKGSAGATGSGGSGIDLPGVLKQKGQQDQQQQKQKQKKKKRGEAAE